MVINDKVRQAIDTYSPQVLYMHDVWIYTVVLALGGYTYFDKTPHTLYRQHTHNAVGQGNVHVEIKRSWKRFFNKEHIRYNTAEQLKEGYYSIMPQKNKDVLDLFLQAHGSIRKRLRIITNKNMRCSSRKTIFLFWLNVLFNRV